MVFIFGNKQRQRPVKAIIIVSVIILGLGFLGLFIANRTINKAKPLLRLTAQEPGVLIFPGPRLYYSIDNKGNVREISEFAPMDVQAYRVDEDGSVDGIRLIDSNSSKHVDSGQIVDHTNEIIALLAEAGVPDPDIYKLYIFGERYFFDVFDGSGIWFSRFTDTIYEYVPTEHKIVKIAKLRSKTIEHLELAE